jgi:prolyl-tRNA synthetase
MGSYGIGITRVMGVIVEKFADDKGLVWPKAVSPFDVYLATVGTDEGVVKAAEELYKDLTDNGIAVLYDDRDARPGEKFADADLYGIPHRVVISSKTLEQNKFELKDRIEAEASLVDKAELLKTISA